MMLTKCIPICKTYYNQNIYKIYEKIVEYIFNLKSSNVEICNKMSITENTNF